MEKIRMSALFAVFSIVGVSLASAYADPRVCADLPALRVKAEAEVIAPYQRDRETACISQDAQFSAGNVVRDRYTLTYACKGLDAAARVVLVRVTFRDAEIRPLHCSALENFMMSTETTATDREF
jgi:hypothetical protein